jgi:hypothetical protein
MPHFFRLAAEARLAAEPHVVTYIDFLTVTLTAMCVLLATLGFIVAALAVIGYRDIKDGAKKAAEAAIVAKLKEYPDAAEMHVKFAAANQVLADMLRQRELLSKVRSAPSAVAGASKDKDSKTERKPLRYPTKGD